MKLLRMLLVPCVFALLGGCVNLGQTHALVTPIGVAGWHSFAPPQRPVNVNDVEQQAGRIAKTAE